MRMVLFAVLIAFVPASAEAAWGLIIRDVRGNAGGWGVAIEAVPARYPTYSACATAGNAVKNAPGFSGVQTVCIPIP